MGTGSEPRCACFGVARHDSRVLSLRHAGAAATAVEDCP